MSNKKRGKTAAALMALRKKYKLGEFSTKVSRKVRSRSAPRKAYRRAPISIRFPETTVKGGSNLTYDINRFPDEYVSPGSNIPVAHQQDPPRPREPRPDPRDDTRR